MNESLEPVSYRVRVIGTEHWKYKSPEDALYYIVRSRYECQPLYLHKDVIAYPEELRIAHLNIKALKEALKNNLERENKLRLRLIKNKK